MHNQPKNEILKNIGIFLAGTGITVATYFAKPVVENKVTEFQQNQQEEQKLQARKEYFENFKASFPKLVSLIEENNGIIMNRRTGIEIYVMQKGSLPNLTPEVVAESEEKNIKLVEISQGELRYDIGGLEDSELSSRTFTKTFKVVLNAPQNNFRGNTGENGFFESPKPAPKSNGTSPL